MARIAERLAAAGLTLALATPVAAQPGSEQTLRLFCSGEAAKQTTESRPVREWDPKTQRHHTRMRPQPVTERFDTDVSVEIAADTGRIRLPKRLISPLNSNAGSSWWDLRELVVADDEITGRYRMNGLERYRVRIDRKSGRILISGSPSFRGLCSAEDPGKRRF